MSKKNPVCVSVINMKGGVGKTTIATHLCHEAHKRGRNVLAVDLDPQANLSQSLMGAAQYRNFLHDNDPSIVDLFRGFNPPNKRHRASHRITPKSVLKDLKDLYSIHSGGLFHLLPSRFNFSDVLIKSIGGNEFVLAQFISNNGGHYDVIFIDCAPTESLLTRTAYHASRHILVPVKPEFLATIGFPLLRESLDKFRNENTSHCIDVCGVVINDHSEYAYSNEKGESRKEIKKTARENGWPIYKSELSYSRGYPKSLRQGLSLAYTSHSGKADKEFPKFANEFFHSINLK